MQKWRQKLTLGQNIEWSSWVTRYEVEMGVELCRRTNWFRVHKLRVIGQSSARNPRLHIRYEFLQLDAYSVPSPDESKPANCPSTGDAITSQTSHNPSRTWQRSQWMFALHNVAQYVSYSKPTRP